MTENVFIPADPNDPLRFYRSGSTEPWTVNIMCMIIGCTKPRILLETGTYLGLTTSRLVDNMPPEAVLHTIDTLDTGLPVSPLVLEHPQVRFHETDALQWIKDYDGPKFEFAFVDDDHSAAHVDQELEVLIPKMAPNSLICLHDVHGIFQLHHVVTKYGGFNLKLPLLHEAGGLGMIQL